MGYQRVEKEQKDAAKEQKEKEEAEDTGSSPPAKKAKVEKHGKASKKSQPQAPIIDADVLKKAQGLNLEAALKNLLGRDEIKGKDIPQTKLLDALKESGGLVN